MEVVIYPDAERVAREEQHIDTLLINKGVVIGKIDLRIMMVIE